jgi:hypothetical protein
MCQLVKRKVENSSNKDDMVSDAVAKAAKKTPLDPEKQKKIANFKFWARVVFAGMQIFMVSVFCFAAYSFYHDTASHK